MAEFNDRQFDLNYAVWKAARFMPKDKRQGDGPEAFAVFARALEAQLELVGYRIVKVGTEASPAIQREADR